MESDDRYYTRRALEEAYRATRALTPQAQEWHKQLSEEFAGRVGGRAAEGDFSR